MPVSPKTFPTKEDFKRLRSENDYDQLYNCEVYDEDLEKGVFRLKEYFSNDPEKKQLLSIALNLPNRIINAGVDYLFGEDPIIRVLVNGQKSEQYQKMIDKYWDENEMGSILSSSAIAIQATGHTQFYTYLREDRPIIAEVPFDMWFPDYSRTPPGQKTYTRRIATKMIVGSGPNAKVYYYVKEFTPGKIEHTLYSVFDKQADQRVPFSTIEGFAESIGANPDETEFIEEVEGDAQAMLAFDVNTRKTVRKRFGQSILMPIMPILEEVNDRLTQVSIQFIKALDPLLQLPSSAVQINEKGQVELKLKDVLLMDPHMPDAKYVANENPMIEQAFKMIDKLIDRCADLTATPRDFFAPSEKGGVESAEALRTRYQGFLKRIRQYQKCYDVIIPKIYTNCILLENGSVPEGLTFTIEYDEGMPVDKKAEVDYYGSAVDAGLMSQERAVGQLQNIEGQELEEEMKRIRAEQERVPRFNPNDIEEQ